jgi:hypothetical protein
MMISRGSMTVAAASACRAQTATCATPTIRRGYRRGLNPTKISTTNDQPRYQTRLGSPYRSGRCKGWLKFKNPAAPAVKREAEEEWGR